MSRIKYIAPAIGAIAIALATAPGSSAGPNEPPCSDMGGSTLCQRIGNVQIYATPQALPTTANTTYGPFVGYHNGRT